MASSVKVKSGFTLAYLDLDRRLKDEMSYQQKLRKLQIAMLELEQIYRVERRRAIIALEGWDASGKSGAIQRLIEKLDPRCVQVSRNRCPSRVELNVRIHSPPAVSQQTFGSSQDDARYSIACMGVCGPHPDYADEFAAFLASPSPFRQG